MTFKDPLYEEVHRRLMAQNKISHVYAKQLLDRIICAYELPENLVIGKLSMGATQIVGLYKASDAIRGPLDPQDVDVAGVDINGTSFCHMTAPQRGTFCGSVNLEFSNLTGHPRLDLFKYEEEREVSGRSTEGDWEAMAGEWEGFETPHLFRIRFEYEDGVESFFVTDDGEYERVYMHSEAFLSMPGNMTRTHVGNIQEWMSSSDRKGLVRVVAETFVESAPRMELAFEPHPEVIENTRSEQLEALKQRNLERLVNVLRIFPRD